MYGVVPADTAARGVDWLPAGASLVPYREVAAVTRVAAEESATQRVRPQLLGYAEILDRLAEAGPVLPVRFGTTLESAAVVVAQVLAPDHDAYAAALAALTGKAQFTVRARYYQDAVIREVLTEQPATARLHQRLHRRGYRRPAAGAPAAGAGWPAAAASPDPADQALRVQLGERVAHALTAKRARDADALAHHVGKVAVSAVLQPAQSLDAERIADLACLVELSRREQFEAAVAGLAQQWRDRARLRLLGPMAPYHFAADLVAGRITLGQRRRPATTSGRG